MRSQDGTDRLDELEVRRLAFDLMPQLPSNPDDACRVVDFMRHLITTHLRSDENEKRARDEDGPLLRVVGGTRGTSWNG